MAHSRKLLNKVSILTGLNYAHIKGFLSILELFMLNSALDDDLENFTIEIPGICTIVVKIVKTRDKDIEIRLKKVSLDSGFKTRLKKAVVNKEDFLLDAATKKMVDKINERYDSIV